MNTNKNNTPISENNNAKTAPRTSNPIPINNIVKTIKRTDRITICDEYVFISLNPLSKPNNVLLTTEKGREKATILIKHINSGILKMPASVPERENKTKPVIIPITTELPTPHETKIFSFSLLVEFSSAPMGCLFNVLNKQKKALFFNIILMLFRLLFITGGILTGNIYYTIIFFVLGDIIGRSLKFYYIFNIAGFRTKKIITNFSKILAYTSPFFILILATNFLLPSRPIVILVQSTLFTFFYYFLIITKTNIVKVL